MSVVKKERSKPRRLAAMLRTGDRMRQPEFHRIYERMPKEFVAELVGGTVYVASPARFDHGRYDVACAYLFKLYELATPGVEAAQNVTAILDAFNEPMPDLLLRIATTHGGRTTISPSRYLTGAPEFVAEVAESTSDIDLGVKKDAYQSAGVIEYAVVAVKTKELFWYRLQAGKTLRPDENGVYRSRCFPGLWVDGPALFAGDARRLEAVVRAGIATPEHARFVRQLEATRRKLAK